MEACHAAKVPISVHVDHAGTDEDIARVLDWAEQGAAVDSVMIDCSHHDTDEDNIKMAKPYCERATKLGLVVEVELGRLAGGEQGVRTIDEGALTRPEKGKCSHYKAPIMYTHVYSSTSHHFVLAERFLTELGVDVSLSVSSLSRILSLPFV